MTRRWSFNTDEIPYADHEKWFYENIKNEKVSIYIAENDKGEKIGQARFDDDGGREARISVNLNPDFFNMGLGAEVIRMSTGAFLRDRTDVNKIASEVIKGNEASLKVFMKAGYSVSGEGNKRGREIIILEYNAGRLK